LRIHSTIKTISDLIAFQNKYVKGRNYTYLVLGSKSNVDINYLKKIGPVTELTLNEIFGYKTAIKP
jgi:hypothetical protein